MNFVRMRAVVRMLLGETNSSNSYWTDSEINAMINDSQLQVATDINGLLTFRDYTTTAGVSRYALPSDYLSEKSLHLFQTSTNKRVLEYKTLDEFESSAGLDPTRQGVPGVYKVEHGAVDTTNAFPGDIWIFPVPDAVYTFRFYYYQKPTDLSADADISEIPESGHWAVCYHAAAMLHLKQANENAYNRFIVLYERAVAKMKIYFNKQQRVKPFYTKDAMGYGE